MIIQSILKIYESLLDQKLILPNNRALLDIEVAKMVVLEKDLI